jgi:hypothetical protein
VLSGFEDCDEQPYAFAWAMVPAGEQPVRLAWRAQASSTETPSLSGARMPGALEVLRFQLGSEASLVRQAADRNWTWSRHA